MPKAHSHCQIEFSVFLRCNQGLCEVNPRHYSVWLYASGFSGVGALNTCTDVFDDANSDVMSDATYEEIDGIFFDVIIDIM